MIISRDFPYNNMLFGLVSYFMTPCNHRDISCFKGGGEHFSTGSLGFDPLYLADGKKSEFLTQVDLPKGGTPVVGPGYEKKNLQQTGPHVLYD